MRARRVDANLTQVVDEFRQLGCSVNVRNDDLADLDVCYGFLCMPVEVKDGRKPPSARKLTKNQLKKRETFTGCIYLVENLGHVYNCAATLKAWHRAISQPFVMDERN